MPPVLEHRLSDIRRRVRQALVVYGVSWVVSVFIGVTFVLCLADWLLHLNDTGVRLILGLSVWGLSGWVAYRYFVTPLRVPLSDVDLALRIEDRYPRFQESLASSVQFLEGRADPRIGSPALQQAVIRETVSRLADFDTHDVLETRAVRRIAVVALAASFMAAAVGVLDTSQTSIALQRLFLPLSAPAWPRQTELELLSAELVPLDELQRPLQIARGDVFKLFAANRVGHLPDKVTLEFQGEDGRTTSEVMRPLTVKGPDGHSREVAVGQVTGMKGEIAFRAIGGDDDRMPWRTLRVIPPPIVERLQVTLTPPSYSRRSVDKLPDGIGHIQGLIGTRVDISGRVSKPLKSAAVRVKDQQRCAIELTGDAQDISAAFLITDAGINSWWFDLKDTEGFEDAEPPRYEVRGIVDAEPEIRIDLPASDMQITPDVSLPIRAVARDDLGLKDIQLVYRREDDDAGKATTIPLFGGESRPREQSVEYLWNLGELGLTDGAQIVLHTEATDDFDLTDIFPPGKAPPSHVGRSVARVLTIVSKEKKLQELAQRQAGLLDDLQRAFKQQKLAREQVGELQLQAQKAGKFRPEDLDMLQRTEIAQRDVAGQLRNPATGIERRARDLFAELRGNHLDDPQSERRLGKIADELERLGDENLPIIEQEFTQARKLLQAGERAPTSPKTNEPSRSGRESLQPPSSPQSGEPSRRPATDSSGSGDESKNNLSQKEGEAGTTGPTSEQTAGDKNESDKLVEKGNPSRPSGAGDREKVGQQNESQDVSPRNRSRNSAADRPETALRHVAENQDDVLDAMSEMLQELSQWRTEHDAGRDLAEMIKQQTDINRKTGDLARQTLTKSGEKLAAQEKADLAKLAERQKKQAEQFEQLESRLQEKADSGSDSSSGANASVRDALEQARNQGIAEQMREAAGQVGENRMGEAARSQESVLEKLRELENTLNDSRESDTEMLVKKLQQAEQDLQSLADREVDLLRKVQNASKLADAAHRQEELQRLQKQQEALRDEAARMVRRLQRLNAHRPAAAAQRAAGRMQKAGEELDQGEQDAGANEQQEALDDLEQAQRELARDRRQAEEQLAREQLDKIANELAAMIDREQAVIDELKRLDAIRQSAGKLTRAQLLALRDLTSVQRSLREDTDRLVEKLTAAEVFAQSLRGAARNMQIVVDLLEARETGADAQQAAENARRRFVDLNDSLKEDKNEGGAKQAQDDSQGGGGENNGREGPQTDGIPAIAQLKVLLALQRELLERTLRLGAVRESGKPLTPIQQQELEALAKEQGELADLARNLSNMATEPTDDAPAGEGADERKGDPQKKPFKKEGQVRD